MRFIRLQLTNFLSYESLDLDLTQVSYTSVTGENGSGKSTIPLAIAWAIYGTTRVSSVSTSVIRDESEYAKAWLDLEDESGTFWRIYRHLPMRGTQTIAVYSSADCEDWIQWGDHLSATAKAKIAELVGMSENAFYSLMLVDQSSTAGGTRFTRSDANTRREILHGLIPELERWSEYHSMIGERSRTINREIVRMEGRSESLVEGRGKAENRVSDLDAEIVAFDATEESLAEERKGYEAKISKITQEIGQTSTRIQDLENKQSAIKSESRAKIAEMESDLASIEHERERNLSAHSSLRTAVEAVKTLEGEIKTILEDSPSLVGDEQARIESHESNIARLDQKIEKIQAEIAAHRSEIQRNEKQISRLKDAAETTEGRCPVCSSELSEDQCHKISAELEESNDGLDSQLLKAKIKLDNLSEKRVAERDAVTEIRGLLNQAAMIEAKIESRKANLETRKQEVVKHQETVDSLPDEKDLDARTEKIRESVKKETESRDKLILEVIEHAGIEDDEEAVSKLRKRLRVVEENLKSNREDTEDLQVMLSRLADAKTAVKEANKEIKQAKKDLKELQTRQEAVNWLYRALSTKGAPAMLLDSVLGAIEESQNEILRRLSVGLPLQVEFRQTRPNKTNDGVKEVLDIIVHTESGVERPIEAFSFGERVLLSLSNVFAMVEVFNRLHPGLVRTIFLDEPLGSLDDVRVPAFVNVIQTVMEAGIVDAMWIITHDQKVVDALPQQVLVAKNEMGDSTMELVA